jgi:hypothetical protein
VIPSENTIELVADTYEDHGIRQRGKPRNGAQWESIELGSDLEVVKNQEVLSIAGMPENSRGVSVFVVSGRSEADLRGKCRFIFPSNFQFSDVNFKH